MNINARTATSPRGRRAALVALLILFLSMPLAAQYHPTGSGQPGGGKLKVMTYNVYAGTEYVGMLTHDLNEFLQASANMVLDIRASDPPGRAAAVARQIAASSPHLVSLQEVFTLSTGPTKDNLTLEYDYLQLLLNALATLGAQYTAVLQNTSWDATVPSALGFARGSWSDVILARSDLKPGYLTVRNAAGGNWTATLVVHLYALDRRADLCPEDLRSDLTCRTPWPRGWVSADVTYGGQRFRFIGAHLDSSTALLEVPQGLELLNGPANTTLPVIVAGDLNCDCSNPGESFYATCTNFAEYGFVDAWSAVHPSDPGYTKDLPNLTKRSDYVMVRNLIAVQTSALVGEEPDDMTETGRYPADHAGVIVKFEHPW